MRRHVVVYGWPDLEGNAVEVVRYLLAETEVPVYWLVEELSPLAACEHLAPTASRGRLHVVPRRSVRGLMVYLTAAMSFFTHGLFLSPKPGRRKVVVNLWHGDGPKANGGEGRTAQRSSFVVSGTRLFGEHKATYFGLAQSQLIVTGNPRCDQFARPCSDEGLKRLGVDPGRPFLMFMPTYRKSRAVGNTDAWSDVEESDGSRERTEPDTPSLMVKALSNVGGRSSSSLTRWTRLICYTGGRASPRR